MKRKISVFVLTLVMLLQGSVFCAEEATSEKEKTPVKISEEYDVFEQVAGYIATYYIDDSLNDSDIMRLGISELLKNDDEMLVKLLKSMLQGLDPYSEFFTKKEYEGFVNNINKTFYGIGVSIEYVDEYVNVKGFTGDSPAESAGIMVGDKISKVNGEDVKGLGLNPVREKIMGELGSSVNITVLRGDKEYSYDVIRGEVSSSTVYSRVLNDKIGYIQIVDMSSHTTEEFAEALAVMDEKNITDIILDLRDNGGGYLSCAVDLSKLIVPKGKIVDTVYRQSFMDKSYSSDLEKPKYKFNVLVNENTASAAEILSSAISESGVGKLIGEKTYGKGVIQSTFPLSNGSVFKLTVGHYITRNGNEINGIGITPEELVSNPTSPIDTSKYTPLTYKIQWKEGDCDKNVLGAKERLYLLRYFGGTLDESFGEDLTEAVRTFQYENDIYPYGILDITTQTKLENEFAKLEVMDDKQMEAAFVDFGGSADELKKILNKDDE